MSSHDDRKLLSAKLFIFLNSYKWHLIIFDIMHKTFAYDYISVIFKNYKNSIEIFNYM